MLNDSSYSSYYPRFDIRRALAYKIQESGQEAVEEVNLPTELIDNASILSSDLLAQAESLIDQIDSTLEDLKRCIGGKTSGGMSVDDYLNALQDGDYVAADLFEDFNIASTDGTTQAEMFCLLNSIKNRAAAMRDFVQENLVPSNIKPITRLAEYEEEMFAAMAYVEYTSPGTLDRLAMAYEAQLKYQVKERLDYMMEVYNSCIDIASSSLNDACAGAAETIGAEMAASGREALEALKEVLTRAFNVQAKEGLELKEQDRLYGGEEIMENLRASAVSLARLRLNASRNVIGWLSSFADIDEDSPLYSLAETALDSIMSIDASLDTTILDLSRAQTMERMNLEDRLDNALRRKKTRQFINLARDILSTVNFSRSKDELRKQGIAAAAAYLNRSSGLCTL